MRSDRDQTLLSYPINRPTIIKISPRSTSASLQDLQDSRRKKADGGSNGEGGWIGWKGRVAFLVEKFTGRQRRSA